AAALALASDRGGSARSTILMRAVPVDDLQRPTGQGKLRIIERAEQRAQTLPSPSIRRGNPCRCLGGKTMLLAENPKILYSLRHHTQTLGVIAMGKFDGGCSGDQKLRPAETEPRRALRRVEGGGAG